MNTRELGTRFITGIFIVGITLAAIILSPYSYVAWLALIGLFATREYLSLEWKENVSIWNTFFPLSIAVLILVAGISIIQFSFELIILAVIGCIIPFLMIFKIVGNTTPQEIVTKARTMMSAFTYIAIPLLSGCLILINDYEYRYILIPVILIWVNDVGAYLVGSKWGNKKIAPSISPGKSVEGTIGGTVLTILAAIVLWRIWHNLSMNYILMLGLTTSVFALAGDLWESSIKRNAGVKDSGSILPGHGGILDRYDSLLFVLPIAALAYCIFVL
ncbi:MAG: phosphatidate cytidylyltransferase [Bacteroidota bacterium]|nr:phosphatidate cytidylyltransferase [Bacteroidota bacterium]